MLEDGILVTEQFVTRQRKWWRELKQNNLQGFVVSQSGISDWSYQTQVLHMIVSIIFYKLFL